MVWEDFLNDEWRRSSKDRLGRGRPRAVGILHRIASVKEQGLEYDADQRRAEILVRDIGVDESSKGVVTPGAVCTSEGGQHREGECRAERNGAESLFRAVAARGNYLGQDRVDVSRPGAALRGWPGTSRTTNGL